MIFLTLLYLFSFSGSWNTLALPTDSRPPEILPKSHLQSIFIRKKTGSTLDRYTVYFGVVFQRYSHAHGSLSIPTFQHPGILGGQSLEDGWRSWDISFSLQKPSSFGQGDNTTRRAILRKNIKRIQAGRGLTHSSSSWVGLLFTREENRVRVLEAKELEELSEAGKIEWPTITEEEIADRSKGDYLSKTIVLFQTTWFIIQCIARGAYGLAVTELEVVTLAFSVLTGVIYYLWWDKPLDVRCSIPVHFLEHRLGKIEDNVKKKDIGTQIISTPEVADQEIRRDEKSSPHPFPSTLNSS
jgi:hypothetical protein